jgi:hypothetical protein
MAKLIRNMLVLAKIQPTVGVDSAPTPAANAILARGVAPQPVVANFVDRDLYQPFFGNKGKVQVGAYSTVEFEVEIAGAGAAGTVPRYDPLLRACGFNATTTASVSVAYRPVTTSSEMVTIWVFLDGVLHKMTDCKGNVSLDLSAAGIPVYRFNFTGFFNGVSDSLPTGTSYTGWTAPIGVTRANTPTFTVHSTAVQATQFTVDMANQVDYRNYIGSETVTFTDRAPTGSCTFEYDSFATKDWFGIVRLGTTGAIQMIHGTTAGNTVQIDMPRVQLTSPTISDDNGIAMLGLTLDIQPNAGNDEIVITVR